MTRQLVLTVLIALIHVPAFTQTYIVNTNVLDVINKKILPRQTVVIERDKIISVGGKKSQVPGTARIIDGSGKFLIPGLVDAHVHFFQSGGLYTRPDVIDLRKYKPYQQEIAWTHENMDDFLRRYTRAGITTVVDVGSTINFLVQRDSFKNKNFAPEIYMTGPLLTTWEPDPYKMLENDEPFYEMKTEDDAKDYVQKQLPYKPDFIKIWFIIRERNPAAGAHKLLPLVKAVINEAHKHNLKVAVHATELITARLAVESGCDFLVHGIDDEIVDESFLQLLKKKNIVLCPTLSVGSNYNEVLGQQYQMTYPDFTMANPVTLGSLFDLRHIPDTLLIRRYKKYVSSQPVLNPEESIQWINLKKMADAGVLIATGTDAGNIGTLHASSYREELHYMKQAGMDPWQILQASTINGAKMLGKEKIFGSIEPGKTANMILLNSNPLDSIENWQKIEMIFNRGVMIRPDTVVKETPLALVQRQLNAYNGHNLDAFLEPYADDIQIFTFPNTLILEGKEQMRKRYEFISILPDLHCEIQKRIVRGNIIIDHERVTGASKNPIEATAIYTIEENKIKKVFFIQ